MGSAAGQGKAETSSTVAVMTGGEGVTARLSGHVAQLRYDQLSAGVIALVKQLILDTLGTSIGASSLAPEGRIIADYVAELGGKPECTVLGFGGKAPAPWATLINGSLGHMLDYDDIGDHCHFGVATVPVALAMAEKLGNVSGRDLITAIAAGTDLHVRLARAIDLPDWTMTEGWFATQLLGSLSGTATAGRLLGLDGARMEEALGIGYTQMSGSRQMAVGIATHLRSMQAGFSGQASIIAAELAKRGIIGSKAVIEGRYGFFRNYVKTETPHWNRLTDGLGDRYPLLDNHCFKVWPACAQTRPTNAAGLRLLQEHNLKPGDIERVTVISKDGDKAQLLSEPVAKKRRPQTSIDAKYSIPFTLAVMMAKGNVTLRNYTAEGLRDPDVLAMADRVDYRASPRTNDEETIPIVEVKTKDGRTMQCQPDSVPGDPKNPVSQDLLEAKFRDCVSFAAKPIAPASVERAIELIRNLENAPDAAEIVRLLSA